MYSLKKKILKIAVVFISFCLIPFLAHSVVCGILVPQPGIEPVPPAMEAWRLNHWTTREVPLISF